MNNTYFTLQNIYSGQGGGGSVENNPSGTPKSIATQRQRGEGSQCPTL